MTLAVTVGIAVGACGSGAFNRPGGDIPDETVATTQVTGTGTGNSGGGTTNTGSGSVRRYGWDLPVGPSSTSTVEDLVYQKLARDRSCSKAQNEIKEWGGMNSPRNVVLYQSAIYLCQGKESQARQMFARGERFGWAMDFTNGTGAIDCPTYQAVRSVLDQNAPQRITCTVGKPPSWPSGTVKDDPREGKSTSATTTTTKTS